jgi:hypothetical protein
MKNIFFFTLMFFSIWVYAQGKSTKDTLYYLLDTAKTPVKDRMWEIHEEYPSLKLLTITCPCLAYGRNPVFVYSTNTEQGKVINNKKVSVIKFVSLTKLIEYVKNYTGGNFETKKIVFIEKRKSNYMMQPVRIIKPSKDQSPVN